MATRMPCLDGGRFRTCSPFILTQTLPLQRARGLIYLYSTLTDRRAARTLRKLEKKLGELPNTWTSKTGGGGRHLFFKWPKGLALTRDTAGKLIGPKVDVLGEGSYAVLPPSRHRSGAAYAWIGDGVDGELAELPFEWRRHLRRQLKKRTASVSTEGTAADNIAVGARNSTLFALASSWRAKGDDEAALLKKLVEVNAIRCKPPLPADELQRIASSASKHAIESDKTDLPTLVAEATLDQDFAQGWHLQAHEGRFYFYDGTHWRPLTDDQLKKAALSALATISTGKKVKTAACPERNRRPYSGQAGVRRRSLLRHHHAATDHQRAQWRAAFSTGRQRRTEAALAGLRAAPDDARRLRSQRRLSSV